MSIIISIITGGIAGWLAGLIRKGEGFGIFGNILVGLAGGFAGSLILGDSANILLQIIISTIGALTLLVLYSLITKLVK